MRILTRPAALAIIPIMLAACTVGPSYERPEIASGGGWSEPVEPTAGALAVDTWWQTFDDPELDELVEKALTANFDVRQREARVAEARALRAAAGGGRYPTVNVSASVTHQRLSENGPLPITQIPGFERDQAVYEPGFDALWELDIFGRTRRAVEAADARIEAARENVNAVRLSIAGEVARSYLELRGAQRELAAATAGVEAATRAVTLTRERLEAGDVAEHVLAQQEGVLAAARAELPLIEARVRAAAFSVGVLAGELPEAGLGLTERSMPASTSWPMPTGERADILRRRPDVRAAERGLAAVTADLGVATAALFPRIAIGARASFQSLDTASLFDAESQAYSVAPLISWRIFDGGRIRAEINAAESRVEIAALGYEQAVIEALGDAERALLRYRAAVESLALHRSAVDSAERAFRYADARFAGGDMSRLELLDAELNLRAAEQAYARAHTRTAADFVALCKALGGGWDALDAAG